MFLTVPGQLVVDRIPAFEDDGISKRSGLVYPGDFTVTVWQDCDEIALPVVISEIDASGEYCLEYTPPSEGYWAVEVEINFSGDFYLSEASVGLSADLTGVKADLSRILGLLHYNAMVDNQTYDSDDQLLTARLRVFNSPSNVPPTPGGLADPNVIQEYAIQAEYTSTNRSRKYTLKKVL